jgi:hypothetical protein
MKALLAMLLLGLVACVNLGCEASAQVDDDDNDHDAKVKIDTD